MSTNIAFRVLGLQLGLARRLLTQVHLFRTVMHVGLVKLRSAFTGIEKLWDWDFEAGRFLGFTHTSVGASQLSLVEPKLSWINPASAASRRTTEPGKAKVGQDAEQAAKSTKGARARSTAPDGGRERTNVKHSSRRKSQGHQVRDVQKRCGGHTHETLMPRSMGWTNQVPGSKHDDVDARRRRGSGHPARRASSSR